MPILLDIAAAPEPEKWIEQIPRYLPPIAGGLGAFIPLLVYSALVGHFKNSALLIFSTFGIQAWITYILTVKIATALNYSDWLTVGFLFLSLLFILLLVSLLQTAQSGNPPPLRKVYIYYSLSLMTLTVAATNFFGFASLHLYTLRVTGDVHTAKKLKESAIESANALENDVAKTEALKKAEEEYYNALHPEIESVTVVRTDKAQYEVLPYKIPFVCTYSIALTEANYNELSRFEIHFKNKSVSLKTKEQFRQDISRWAFGDIYETDL